MSGTELGPELPVIVPDESPFDGGETKELFPLDSYALHIATRVIATAELLDLILSFIERIDLAKTALVSQVWLEISRRHIWQEVENAWELFALLAPLGPLRGHQGYEFERVPSHQDWLRFQPFATRVRKLRIEGVSGEDDYTKVVSSLLSKLAYTRLWHPVLPNLKQLEWYQDEHLAQMSLFLHPGLEELIMYVPMHGLPGYTIETICDDIAWKAPNIRYLELVPMESISSSPIEVALSSLLSHLDDSLQTLYLPIYGLTQVVFETASRLQHVKEIAFSTTQTPTVVALYSDVLVFTPHLEPNAFPALRKLSVSAPLADLIEILTNPDFPASRITDFLVRAARPETPAAVEDFHATVARECGSLNIYSLVLSAPNDEKEENARWVESPSPDTALSWTTLAPLASAGSLRGLVSIAIAHEHALKLSVHELANFARALPTLEYLVCNPSPHAVGDIPPGIKLIELGILADAMPRVETLELYVDASDATIDYPAWSENQFPNLRNLWMGASPVHLERRKGISLFLAALLPLGARIDTERWEIWDYVAPEARYAIEWDRIAEDVALLMESRAVLAKAIMNVAKGRAICA
ncbi:unnamed protein product [Peniophora sp. CBMAI 1063]|nr:unnamed protein product [Peniophora sp. CBMAI 1063]